MIKLVLGPEHPFLPLAKAKAALLLADRVLSSCCSLMSPTVAYSHWSCDWFWAMLLTVPFSAVGPLLLARTRHSAAQLEANTADANSTRQALSAWSLAIQAQARLWHASR